MPGMNSMLGLAVGICGAAFIGYCIYFDNKRRSDPNFKKRLRERRKAAREETSDGNAKEIPIFRDAESMQKFFIREIQLGEEYMSQGDIVNGVEHLANAIAISSRPQHLLTILNKTLPPQVFQMLLQELANFKKQPPGAASAQEILTLAEEDVE